MPDKVVGYVISGVATIIAVLSFHRSSKKDVPQATVLMMDKKIKDHAEEEDKERKERAEAYQDRLELSVTRTIKRVLKEKEEEKAEAIELAQELQAEREQRRVESFNALTETVHHIRDEVKQISKNCKNTH